MKTLRAFILATTVLFAFTALVDARLIRAWSYQELLDQSELVVIATPVAVRDTEEQMNLPDYSAMRVIGVETKFAVAAVLKGDGRLKEFVLHHYRAVEADKHFPNAPHLVSFDPQKSGAYLIFLVREADGRYAPVSGQTDPGYIAVHALGRLP